MPSATTIARTVMRGAIAATALSQIAGGDVGYGLFCLAALGASVALSRAALDGRGGFAAALELAVLGLMLFDMTLGNQLGMYERVAWWDKLLHFGGAAVLGLLGFWFIYIVHATGRIRLHPVLDGIAILLITLGLGAVWEIAEYGVDQVFGRATQGSPGMGELDDSMFDLMLDGIGAIVAAVIGPLAMRYSPGSRRKVERLGRELARHERA